MHAIDRGAPYREEAARGIAYRHEHVTHETRDARDDAAAQRPIHRRATAHVAAANGEIGALVDRLDQGGHDLRRVREVGVHHDENVTARLLEAGDHGRREARLPLAAHHPYGMPRRETVGDLRSAV